MSERAIAGEGEGQLVHPGPFPLSFVSLSCLIVRCLIFIEVALVAHTAPREEA